MYPRYHTERFEQNRDKRRGVTRKLALSCPIYDCDSAQVYNCHQYRFFPFVKWPSRCLHCMAYFPAAHRESDMVRWPHFRGWYRVADYELIDGWLERYAHRLSGWPVFYLLRLPCRSSTTRRCSGLASVWRRAIDHGRVGHVDRLTVRRLARGSSLLTKGYLGHPLYRSDDYISPHDDYRVGTEIYFSRHRLLHLYTRTNPGGNRGKPVLA